MEDNKVLSCLGLIFGVVLLIAVSAILNGWVLSIMWSWFIVKTFGLAPLSIPAAIGLAMVVGFLTKSYNSKSDKKTSDTIAEYSAALLGPFVTLFIAWIVYSFM